MKRMQYLVHISRDPDSDWGASVPDLPGCVATGATIEAAEASIRDAIQFHLDGLREDGIEIPSPSVRVEYVEVTR